MKLNYNSNNPIRQHRARAKVVTNQKYADEYLTDHLIGRYKQLAEVEVVRVPPIIFDLLVFSGTLKGLRRCNRLIRANKIEVPNWTEVAY